MKTGEQTSGGKAVARPRVLPRYYPRAWTVFLYRLNISGLAISTVMIAMFFVEGGRRGHVSRQAVMALRILK
ncbi:MAG: hypothetical protein A3I61_02125 [Acidobacteria bacterium RIFCSPLOWO2_02_FULL_68_18]|nr:MAG: hypothetical protein A3I61_02125 [Acidobacteria bacterium RIFCSPLOWO2_02_FULL_68_18]